MEVARDPLAVLEHHELLEPRVQARVVDRDAGHDGERDRERFVVLGELGTVPLLAEVEVAEDLAAHEDGHAEERVHRGMVRREAGGIGMGREVGEPQRARIHDESAEQTLALRERTDRRDRGVVDADGDEVGESTTVREHPERPVAGPHERCRGLDDPLEHDR